MRNLQKPIWGPLKFVFRAQWELLKLENITLLLLQGRFGPAVQETLPIPTQPSAQPYLFDTKVTPSPPRFYPTKSAEPEGVGRVGQ